MPEYRAFLVGPDGHFHSAQVIEAVDDAAAVEAAKPRVDGHDVEVWQRDRKITVLIPNAMLYLERISARTIICALNVP